MKKRRGNNFLIIMIILLILGCLLLILYFWNLKNETKLSPEFLKCLNETKFDGDYIPGLVFGRFKSNVSDEEINNFVQEIKSNYPNVNITVYKPPYTSRYDIEIPKGTEIEWVCKLQENKIISEAYPNYITYASAQ